MIRLLLLFSLTILGVGFAPAQTQKPSPSPTPVTTPQTADTVSSANPADVASMDAIIAAVYDVISGPAGKKRDWDRMRSLFIPGARLIPTGPRPTGGYGSRAFTVEDYVARTTPIFEKEGFFETERARRTESFGQIAHLFSTYESRLVLRKQSPFNAELTAFN